MGGVEKKMTKTSVDVFNAAAADVMLDFWLLRDELWDAVIADHPDAVRRDLNYVLSEWYNPLKVAGQADPNNSKTLELEAIISLLQFDVCVFYESGKQSDGTYMHKGCRFGIGQLQCTIFGPGV